jgi:hypothetical protein|tara:strand:+ start:256 stop:543 length:288 start_codon:yes stop_codon:yes gene_type:complete
MQDVMKLQSKSLILENLINEIDTQLAAIPSHDHDGSPIEDSMSLDMYIDGVANINFVDGIGRKHYPINKTVATILVEDELKERQNQPTEEDKYVK